MCYQIYLFSAFILINDLLVFIFYGYWILDISFCRKLKLEENVANIWPEFGSNGKDLIKVWFFFDSFSFSFFFSEYLIKLLQYPQKLIIILSWFCDIFFFLPFRSIMWLLSSFFLLFRSIMCLIIHLVCTMPWQTLLEKTHCYCLIGMNVWITLQCQYLRLNLATCSCIIIYLLGGYVVELLR